MATLGGLTRIVLSVSFCLLLASVAHAAEPDKLPDRYVYIPGNSNQMRWDFLKDRLQRLCKSNKAEVEKLLGVGMHCSERPNQVSYRITDNLSKEAFTDEYYELEISFDKNKVSSLEIHVSRDTFGYGASELL